MEQNIQMKCRQCRTIIMKVLESNLLDAHSDKFSTFSSKVESHCHSVIGRTEIYLNEDALEPWIQAEIEKSEWTKGKLKCIKCAANVGSFDFVTGQKCDCKLFNQPSVHFSRSKIDLDQPK